MFGFAPSGIPGPLSSADPEASEPRRTTSQVVGGQEMFTGWLNDPAAPAGTRASIGVVDDLRGEIDRLAEQTGFSGVVRVDRDGAIDVVAAYGLAHRGWVIPNTVDTRFAIASGGKGFTALAVASLIEDGALEWSTTARSVLGADLPLIDDAVTVEQLLANRSGIGDYLDEATHNDVNDYVMTTPVHELATTEAFLAVLDGHPSTFPPDERFEYCNGGFVVLALIAERASGVPYHDLVLERVCGPAGLHDTDFLRSDELPGGVALGYLHAEGSCRTNVFHLPVRGNGDGGIYSTLADVHTLWAALFAGRIVAPQVVAAMVRPRSVTPEEERRYGLGFWLHPSGSAVMLEGYDAGVSFRTTHDPVHQLTHTVISNTSEGAWPLVKRLNELLAG
jgi:CubicO group peptidase (beta-lactamase class C family)